jgi:hypothetical protein
MPDNDIFRRYVAREWRAATRCFHGDTEPKEVAGILVRSVGRALRRYAGVPELPTLVSLYTGYCGGRITATEAFGQVHSIQAKAGYQKQVQLAARVVTRLIAYSEVAETAPEHPAEYLAIEVVREMIKHNVLDPSIPEVENLGRFATLEERRYRAMQCQQAIDADVRLRTVAEQLLADPNATRLRVPRSEEQRVSLGETLNMVVC